MKRIHANSCIPKVISDNSIVKEFLDVNHLQGYVKSNFKCGLFYKNELVMLMTFGKPRYDKNYQWEIIRECTKKGIIVYEGCSTLWKFFLRNRQVRSCVVYSYPHNSNYTEHYIKYCGFINANKSSVSKRDIYKGSFKGKNFKITEQELARNGVDRILSASFGTNNGTNKDILLSIGFVKEQEEYIKPQKDIYFPYGVVYKVTDLDTGDFYIGKTEVKGKLEKGYLGSGKKWKGHIAKYPNKDIDPDNGNSHKYQVDILKSDFKTPKELKEYEVKEIKKYGEYDDELDELLNKHCMNLTTREQGEYTKPEVKSCSECGGRSGMHKKSCSKYVKKQPCQECGSTGILHYKTCSKYSGYRKKSQPCQYCGGKNGHHYKNCKLYIELVDSVCPECGGKNGHHTKNCSHAKCCPECGGLVGHYKTCSKYREIICEECGGKAGMHRKDCSKYKQKKKPEPCQECGRIYGHKKFCSHFFKNRSELRK